MVRESFRKLFTKPLVVLDGASGTQMMKWGMPKGVCPEKWAIENPEVLIAMQKAYVEAGSDIVYTFTFGASRFKLAMHGLGEETFAMNEALAKLSRKAVGDKALVAGDLAPCGKMILPYGDTPFEDIVSSFQEQVKGLLSGGVDFFVIETMMDLQEARAAVLAVRSLCDLPIMATMTFEEGMRTLSGTDPVSALVTLQSMGCDAVGANCSSGPDEMIRVIQTMQPYAQIPLIAKPNAGKASLFEGKTVFNMDVQRFTSFVPELLASGVQALGGCCGTDPDFIAALKQKALEVNIVPITDEPLHAPVKEMVCSNRKALQVGINSASMQVGRRLCAYEDANYIKTLRNADVDELFDLAREDVDDGADVVLCGVGFDGLDEMDEVSLLRDMVQTVAGAVSIPICIDTRNAAALEAALRIYPGRCMVHALSMAEAENNGLLAVAQQYGALLVNAEKGVQFLNTTEEM